MDANEDTSKTLSANLFPVVGIGASAGGLEAFQRLLKAIPADSGMAYVLVQHLDPNHESLLTELLQKATPIPVLEISDDIKVQPNHIYIIPSNKMLVANDGILQLSPRPLKSKNERNLPIDLFFVSLAEVHQAHAIGVVLSGNGADGTRGLKAIKAAGGVTFAQDEASATVNSMPKSAVDAGVVDFILPPEEIPQKLQEVKSKIIHSDADLQNLPQEDEQAFKHILALVRVRKATDFTHYKQTTIRRRILRRMAFHKNETPAAYLHYLRENKTEQEALFQDLLISVTAFFRDAKIFEHICTSGFLTQLKNTAAGQPVRIWVAGCSTGEEAYSIAMCLKECLGDNLEKTQIFATDLSEKAIFKARAAIYSQSDLEGVSAERLETFFTKINGQYRVNKAVHDMCIFAVHDFLKDPPFGKIDLVSCRNVLIYMEPYLQKKALTTFHYALNPKGFLLLGKSENNSVSTLFVPVDKHDKLFMRKDAPGKFMHLASQRSEQSLQQLNDISTNVNIQTDFQKTADDILLNRYTPAGVIINEAMDIVHFRGNTDNYLGPAPGKPSHNLLKMAKNGLGFELRNIVHKAQTEHNSVIKENIPVQIQGTQHFVSIEAVPLPNIVEPHYLILFLAHPVTAKQHTAKTSSKTRKEEKDLRIEQLGKELVQNREDMRSITEDQEAVNEELQSANEELLSGSEELQSLNEELETSKEELQSTNEELTVVNQELISLNEQVTTARNYAEAIVSTIRQPLLILDKNLRVKTANEAFYRTFQVTKRDTEGILIYDLGNKQWNIPALQTLLEEILPLKTKINDFEVTHFFPNIGERVMLLNIREMIREEGKERLILLAIEDTTDLKRHHTKIQEIQQKHAKELEEKIKQRTFELIEVNQHLAVQMEEKERRSAELVIANRELAFQNEEKEKRAVELVIANKELQAFTYVSSHDLQEPLRKIQTFATIILDKEHATLSDKGKDYFRRMQDAAMRMQQLIADLLAFSRLGTAERTFVKTDLHVIAAETKNDFKEILAQKNATLEILALDEVSIIPFQFRQLLQNLISNAIKFADPERPLHITLKSVIGLGSTFNATYLDGQKNLSAKIRYCHLTVLDNGIGFEAEYKDRIFELFQRLHKKEAYAGTGIGLSIVKKIVENHHGIIIATGTLGKGAQFDIFIPVDGPQ